jgi:hypothetical protein
MTLFELQAWLGHRTPATTQHYAKITPNTLTRAYTQAGYFARNLCTIEVLLDRDAVASGAAASGEPWQYYDLGHGFCSYTFFEQCPHRMACAKCDFYTPKDSTKARLTTCFRTRAGWSSPGARSPLATRPFPPSPSAGSKCAATTHRKPGANPHCGISTVSAPAARPRIAFAAALLSVRSK